MNPHIQTAVEYAAKVFDVTPEAIMSRSRKRPFVLARQALMVGVRGWGLPQTEVGAMFGRDHATVHHAEAVYADLRAAPGTVARKDCERMRDVMAFTVALRTTLAAEKRAEAEKKLATLRAQSLYMTATELIHAHASELARLLPDEHPLKAGIERLERQTNLHPLGGTSTTNSAKN
jgi:hypothetical protein